MATNFWGCLLLLDTVKDVSKGTHLPAARAFSAPNPEPGRREQRAGAACGLAGAEPETVGLADAIAGAE